MDERLNDTFDQLERTAKGNDLESLKDIVKRFSITMAAGARAEAQQLSKEAFELEKKYVPQMPHNKSMSQKLKCQNMIMTVGAAKSL